MIANDWEKNLLLFRGKSSDEIVTLSQDQLLKLKSSGVKKFIISIGTVDLLQLPHSEHNPKEAATKVAASISTLSQTLSPGVQICTIIPSPNRHVSETAYSRFVNQLERELKDSGVTSYIYAGTIMAQCSEISCNVK